ncbi:Peroxisomal adenine nucleotide transporter [Lachnellula hyalina]|uniref:Peroxisomal adenine nucleotide transporter n=1 Tax=Lachnellula hyalina TaxID=1316788 RepID=A0A8H8R0R1_9HELO|nr:Peroxisomal adenine nucleotide transporter [Lachnellula hyalina]TVY25951.1 Peroxisomal adenine nucleotide transporter [Lachnellula hyalina]
MANIYNSQLDAFTLYHKNQENSSSTFNGPALPALGHALAGSTGAAISNLAIYPLDLIITRLQVQRQLRKSSSFPEEGEYEGVLDAFSQIYNKEGGLSAFYTGVLQDTGKSIVDSFLFFLLYNYLRTNRLQKNGTNTTTLPVLDELTVGALAGACSKFFTTPISNIVTRKQTASMLSARNSYPFAEPSVSDIVKSIRAEKGIQGFWSGYSASLILTLNPSITFFLYEFFKRSLVPRTQRDDPGAKITFLMAAISKSIASTITYPFSLAKSRAQTSSSPPVNVDSARELKKDVYVLSNTSDAKKAGSDAEKIARSSTVFSTILNIYRTEGAAALYEGILGEILKGFFSHGITMLVKESVHKLIIQTYYMILKALDKYPSPAQIADQTGVAVSEGYGVVVQKVGSVVESGKGVAGDAVERAGVIGNNATEAAKTAGSAGKDVIANTAEKVGVVGNKASDPGMSGEELVSKDAGHLLGNAQDQLGDKLVGGGNGLKPEKE